MAAVGGTIRGLRWWLIALVMAGTAINFLTRAVLGNAAPTMNPELGISEWQYSLITTAFQIGIMMQPFVGYFLDLIGLRRGLALFAAAWGVTTMAHGLANSWQAVAGLRGAMGVAEGSGHPGGLKVVAEYFPAKERGFATGIYNIGASMGGVLAPPLVFFAVVTWNWRAAFVVSGALGLIWALAWLACYRPRAGNPRLSPEERAHIEAGQEPHLQAAGARPSFLEIARQRNFWGIALPRFLADPTWGTLTYWLPLYLFSVRGFDLKAIALTFWLPFVAADLGCLFGPTVTFWLQRRGMDLIRARKCAFTLGALMMTSMLFVPLVASPAAAILLLCLGAFAHQTLSITVIALSSDLFRAHEIGTAAGSAGLFANLGVLLFSLAIGGFVVTVGYTPFFVALALLDLIGAVLLWTLVRAPKAA
jgi:ACS family hexuronate transporter-like MFS transporter